jgi:hypothetical protein
MSAPLQFEERHVVLQTLIDGLSKGQSARSALLQLLTSTSTTIDLDFDFARYFHVHVPSG